MRKVGHVYILNVLKKQMILQIYFLSIHKLICSHNDAHKKFHNSLYDVFLHSCEEYT